jgi:serine/threonine protein kinase
MLAAMVGADDRPAETRPGDRVGPYRLESVLGEGGAGVVYRAIREPDGGIVAVKLLRARMAADSVQLRRFEHEVRAARAIRHPHLVPLLDSGEESGRPYLVSRYMSGGSLAGRLQRSGPLEPRRAAHLIAQIAAGLAALHAAEIVHRDVTAGNVLLEPDGAGALGDFGLARGPRDTMLTRPGRALGTLDFLAPELLRGRRATPASDIYALGCVAFAALTGAPPFGGRGPMQAAYGHLEETPRDPCEGLAEAPHGLGEVVLAALRKEPSERPGGAAEFGELLLSVVAS